MSADLGWPDPHHEFERRAVAEAIRDPAALDGEPSQHESPESEELRRLARLDRISYDRQREAAAERLGVRVSTLDSEVTKIRSEAGGGEATQGAAFELGDPERWPTPVDGAALLDGLVEIEKRYLALPAFADEALALWVVHAHAHGNAHISPILAVTSPAPECGKTTLLTLLSGVTPRPLLSANLTASSLFRAVEKWEPTLLIDEADSYLRDNEELRGVLNSGHNRSGAWILRCTGEDHEPRGFATWCAKAIALIGSLPATLASRAIHIEMRRLKPEETVQGLRADRLGHLEPYRQQAWRWARDHSETLSRAEPEMPASLRGRAADNWRPLLAIADVVGGDWPERARQAAAALQKREDAEGRAILALRDIKDLFEEHQTDRLPSADIVKALTAREDRPWPEYRNGKPITTRQLASLLKGFGVEPRGIRLDSGKTPRGYLLEDFNDAFARYTPSLSATVQQVNNHGGFDDFPSATGKGGVADEKRTKPNRDGVCGSVADGPLPGPRKEMDL